MRWLIPLLCIASLEAALVEPVIAPQTQRPWPGRDFWPNPAEDWQLSDGRITNRFSGSGHNLVVLTAEIGPTRAPVTVRARVGQVSFELYGKGFVGFELGRRGTAGDYRDDAVNGAGLPVGVDFDGRPFIGQVDPRTAAVDLPLGNVQIEFKADPIDNQRYRGTLRVLDSSDKELGSAQQVIHGSRLEGLVALMATTSFPETGDPAEPRPAIKQLESRRGDEGRFAFSGIVLAGDKVEARPERAFGPVLWATHTLDNKGTLRLLAQVAPFARNQSLEGTLELPGREPVYADLDPSSRTLRFRVLRQPTDRETPYKILFAGEEFSGVIPPVPTGEVKVASLSCNDSTGFPHQSLVENVASHEPDLVIFHGDQIYEEIGGYGVIYDQRPNDRAMISYLRKYFLHGWTWRELLRNTPSITLPDDHDVFHGNLWGDGGAAADVSEGYGDRAQDGGGYKMSVEFVNAVHRTQTGNLPEPADPAPCRSGMSVYFTRFPFGPLDIVVLADRQFKSAPAPLFPSAQIDNGWPQAPHWDPTTESAHPEAELLGPRQEAYLRRWAEKPAPDTRFRLAVSQTPWCATQTLPRSMSHDRNVPNLKVYLADGYAPDDEPKADFDTNGWPQPKRTLALELLKQAGAVHLVGDQHLATTGQYGLEGWDDGPWWIATPAIANIWPRRWMPSEEGTHRRPGDPRWLGRFKDAFGNPITLHAVANPHKTGRQPSRLYDRAVGYVITSWNPANGEVELATWPYWAAPGRASPDNQPYPGWPITIDPRSGKRLK